MTEPSAANETIVVARRFRGPPTSGNGGYCAGLLAERLGGVVEVTLRAPPPLDQPLSLACDAVRCALHNGEQLVAEARPGTLQLELPAVPTFERAASWSQRFAGSSAHTFPECFVCGPQRAKGDGLRIFPGPNEDATCVGAAWVPTAEHGDDGIVSAPIAWAALDCPGYFAAASGEPALLGRMTAELLQPLRAGERYVVLGWPLGREGRKRYAATALFDAAGTAVGRAQQTWIALQSLSVSQAAR